MIVMIGSVAVIYWFPEFSRSPKDTDYFSDTVRTGDVFYDPRLEKYEWQNNPATPDELYTIKASHSHWEVKNGSWGKHMADILFFQERGCKLIPELYNILYPIWEDLHGKKKMSFSESPTFFKDAVLRKYDHDSVHDSVAFGDTALYERFLVPGKTVAIDSGKMWSSDHDTLVRLFREEVYATALERIVIPRNYNVSPGYAYHWALRRTITSLTKGKSSLWLIENFKDFKSVDDGSGENYVQRHLRKSSKLIPLKEEVYV